MMIWLHTNSMCCTLKVVSLYFKALCNSSKLFLEDIILHLYVSEALRVIGNRVLVLLY
jgi:hypothetical protein